MAPGKVNPETGQNGKQICCGIGKTAGKEIEMLKLRTENHTYRVYVDASYTYPETDSLYVEIIDRDGDSFADLTVCLPGYGGQGPASAFVDTENCPWAEDFIRENHLGHPRGFAAVINPTGKHECRYPLYEFDMQALLKGAPRWE